jgi:hypothetical protein
MSPNFIHTYVSVDCVVFGFDHENRLNILLVKRRLEDAPNEKQSKLPGSLIFSNEDVDVAQRVLLNLQGLRKWFLNNLNVLQTHYEQAVQMILYG